MDLNYNSAEKSTSSTLKSKRDYIRNHLRRQELELQFQAKRRLLQSQEMQLQQKKANLKLDETVLCFNKIVQDALESVLLGEFALAVLQLQDLPPLLKNWKNHTFKNCTDLDLPQFEELTTEVDKIEKDQGDNPYLTFIKDLLDEIYNLIDQSQDDSTTASEVQYNGAYKCLQLLEKQSLKHSSYFLKKYFRNSLQWLQAVLRQQFCHIDDELLDMVLKCLPQTDAWLILIPIQNIQFREQLANYAWISRSTEAGLQFIKRSLANDQYLKKYLSFNLFSGLAQVYQQAENKAVLGTHILEIIISICCVKMNLLDKVITSGLAQMIACSRKQDFSYEGFQHVYKLVFWLKQNDSDLFRRNLKEEVWFQSMIRLLLTQQSNMLIQQSACDQVKQWLSEPNKDPYANLLAFDGYPDNISSQLSQFIK